MDSNRHNIVAGVDPLWSLNSWSWYLCRLSRSLVLYVCFVDRCLSFCPFSFGHCVVCSSSICGFWLLLWYLQTLLIVWLYMDCRCRSSYQEGVGVLITVLTPPHSCACPKQGPCFPNITCFQWIQLRWEMIIRFADIGGIDDHHCLNFLFVTVMIKT